MLVILCLIWGVELAADEDRAQRNSAVEHAHGDRGARRADALSGVPRSRPQPARADARRPGRMSSSPRCSISSPSPCSSSFAQLTAATSRVTILAYTMPIWAVLLAWPFLGERPTRMQIDRARPVRRRPRHPDLSADRDGHSARESGWRLSTGVCWAAGTVYLKWARIQADPMGVASWQVTIAFIVIAALHA